jgi:hypothetical protein
MLKPLDARDRDWRNNRAIFRIICYHFNSAPDRTGPFHDNPDQDRIMKRTGNAMFGTVLLLSAIAAIQVASAAPPARQWSAAELADRTVERRAVEAVFWGMPAVNFELMLQAFQKLNGTSNQVAYWSRPLDWKNQTLTPNPDTIYLMPFYDVHDGPMVLEIPPAEDGSITGSIDDSWQNALEDVGPAGADKGSGGKYLILPPDFKDAIPDGYMPVHSDTYRGFAILRSNLSSGSDADIAKAVAYGKRIRFYPLNGAATQTTFVDAYGQMFDATIPYDARFFDALNRFVQAEPWLARDRVMIDMLGSIGIRQGQPYAPDAKTQRIFDAAAREARASLDVQYERSSYRRSTKARIGRCPPLPKSPKGCKTCSRDRTDIRSTAAPSPIRWRTSARSRLAPASST